jgi:1-acyl-sn-glycerol-3-phosphate acyltransferase
MSRLSQWATWRFLWPISASVFWFLFRHQAKGHQQIPQDGPFLLLPNHTSTFDPVWVAFFCWRPVTFMASAQLFRLPALAWFIRLLGAFPKARGIKDRAAMQEMQKLWDQGMPVMIFPEGLRTWDGRTRPAVPGIGRLIKRLNAKVVYARIKTGHQFQPRWADFPRWVPVHVEYDGPHDYSDWSTDDLLDEVNQRLRVEHKLPAPGFTLGFRMAEGLPAYLWACPDCYTPASLAPVPRDRNRVACRECGAEWLLDTSNRMLRDEHEPLWVCDALDAVVEHYGTPPVLDADRFSERRIALEVEGASVGRLEKGKKPTPLADGRLVLDEDCLSVTTLGQVPWSCPLDEIRVVNVELGNVLQLRTKNQGLLQIRPGEHSTLMWEHFVEAWRALALERAAEARKLRVAEERAALASEKSS